MEKGLQGFSLLQFQPSLRYFFSALILRSSRKGNSKKPSPDKGEPFAKNGCFDEEETMKAKILIIISIVVCFSFGCASTSKKTWPKCVHCGAVISTKEGTETFTEEGGQPFSIMGVGSGTAKTLSDSKAFTVHTIVGQGTAWATIGDKTFDDLIWEFGTVLRTEHGHTVGRSYYKFTTPNGQYFVLEGNGDVLQSGAWDILNGTGKWGGITGKAKGKLIIHGRPLSTETEQYRFRLDGKLKSPKWE